MTARVPEVHKEYNSKLQLDRQDGLPYEGASADRPRDRSTVKTVELFLATTDKSRAKEWETLGNVTLGPELNTTPRPKSEFRFSLKRSPHVTSKSAQGYAIETWGSVGTWQQEDVQGADKEVIVPSERRLMVTEDGEKGWSPRRSNKTVYQAVCDTKVCGGLYHWLTTSELRGLRDHRSPGVDIHWKVVRDNPRSDRGRGGAWTHGWLERFSEESEEAAEDNFRSAEVDRFEKR